MKMYELFDNNFLKETPILVDIDLSVMEKKVFDFLKAKKIELYMLSNTNINNILVYEDIGMIYFFYYDESSDKGIEAYASYEQLSIKSKTKAIKVMQQKDIYKKSNNIKNFTLNTMQLCSKMTKKPILSDDKHSPQMMKLFNKFFNNPKKYQINDLYLYDNTKEKIITSDELEYDVWDYFKRSKRYLIIIDFYKYFKESKIISFSPKFQ